MACKFKFPVWGVIAFVVPLGVARAQEESTPTEQQIKQVEKIMEQTKGMGPWERQSQVMDDAVDNMFQQQGWTSESDKFSHDLLRDVSRIPPWKPAERQEIFMNALQTRLNLSHDQRTQLDKDMQREAMAMTMKHFKDLMPIAMEVATTRMRNEPFTPEQVQRWSTKFKPLMDESLEAVQRVGGRLEETMTPDQKAKFEKDMDALLRRHHDVEKMVTNWQNGKWTPTDWGLQNDPVHAGVMPKYAAKEAEKNALVEAQQIKVHPDESKISVDESSWDKYVKWFCHEYECTDVQRGKADNVLKSSKKEAVSYRSSKRVRIEQAEALAKGGSKDAKAKAAAADLAKLQEPIVQIFERLKKRLYEEVLTTQQRQIRPLEPMAKSKS